MGKRTRDEPRLICEDKKVCECKVMVNPAKDFEPESFRTIKHPKPTGARYVIIGCPKGKWDFKKERCKVGTRAHKIVYPLKRCK